MTPQEINATIKTLEIVRDIAITEENAGSFVVWDLQDTLQMLKQKLSKQDKAQSASHDFINTEIRKWKSIRSEAVKEHDDSTIAIAMCYINAYERVLSSQLYQKYPHKVQSKIGVSAA